MVFFFLERNAGIGFIKYLHRVPDNRNGRKLAWYPFFSRLFGGLSSKKEWFWPICGFSSVKFSARSYLFFERGIKIMTERHKNGMNQTELRSGFSSKLGPMTLNNHDDCGAIQLKTFRSSLKLREVRTGLELNGRKKKVLSKLLLKRASLARQCGHYSPRIHIHTPLWRGPPWNEPPQGLLFLEVPSRNAEGTIDKTLSRLSREMR